MERKSVTSKSQSILRSGFTAENHRCQFAGSLCLTHSRSSPGSYGAGKSKLPFMKCTLIWVLRHKDNRLILPSCALHRLCWVCFPPSPCLQTCMPTNKNYLFNKRHGYIKTLPTFSDVLRIVRQILFSQHHFQKFQTSRFYRDTRKLLHLHSS